MARLDGTTTLSSPFHDKGPVCWWNWWLATAAGSLIRVTPYRFGNSIESRTGKTCIFTAVCSSLHARYQTRSKEGGPTLVLVAAKRQPSTTQRIALSRYPFLAPLFRAAQLQRESPSGVISVPRRAGVEQEGSAIARMDPVRRPCSFWKEV